MAGNTGGLYGELGIDISQAQAALDSANKLIRATSLNLGQLIDKMGGAGGAAGGAAEGNDKLTNALKRQNAEGEKNLSLYQRMRGEHREMAFYSRNSQEVIFGTMLAFQALSGTMDEGSESAKKIKTAMMEGSQAFLGFNFMLQALGVAGPMGLAIAGVGALVIVLSKLGGEMDEIQKKGLDAFATKLAQIGGGNKMFFAGTIADLQDQQRAAEEMNKRIQATPSGNMNPYARGPLGALVNAFGAQAAKEVAAEGAEKEDSAREKILEKIKEQVKEQQVVAEWENRATELARRHATAIELLKLDIEQIGKQLDGEYLTDARRLELIDQRIAKQNELKQLQKGSVELATDDIAIAKQKVELQQGTNLQVLTLISHALTLKMLEKDRLALEIERQRTIQNEVDLENQRRAAVKADAKTQTEGLDALWEIQNKSGARGSSDKEDSAVAVENLRHNKVLADIDIAHQKAGLADIDEFHKKAALEAEDAEHREQLRRIAAAADKRDMDNLIAGATDLASALEGAFSRAGDTALSKFMQVLQVGFAIVKQLDQMDALSASGQSTTGSALGILGSIAGLFAEGGYTGQGARQQPAGVVHRGEYVFEKPLVDQYGGALASIRHAMQHGISMSSYAVGGPVGSLGSTGSPFGPRLVPYKLDLSNGQLFFRREWPEFDRFNKKKMPGS